MSDLLFGAIACGVSAIMVSPAFIWMGLTALCLMRGREASRRLTELASEMGLSLVDQAVVGRLAISEHIRAAEGDVFGYVVRLRVEVFPHIGEYLRGRCFRVPRVEARIDTPLLANLRIGAKLEDSLGRRRSYRPANVVPIAVSLWSLADEFGKRDAAAARVNALLDSPRVTVLASDLGPRLLGASDDTIALILLKNQDVATVRRACVAAGRIAEVLPEVRRELPPTAIDRAARALEAAASEWVSPRIGGVTPFEIGVFRQSHVSLEIDTGVPLRGLGYFMPGPGGPLIHRAGRHFRPAAMSRPFDSEQVSDAIRALPALTTVRCDGSRIHVFVEPRGQGAEAVVRASFELALALRHAALRGARS